MCKHKANALNHNAYTTNANPCLFSATFACLSATLSQTKTPASGPGTITMLVKTIQFETGLALGFLQSGTDIRHGLSAKRFPRDVGSVAQTGLLLLLLIIGLDALGTDVSGTGRYRKDKAPQSEFMIHKKRRSVFAQNIEFRLVITGVKYVRSLSAVERKNKTFVC